MKQRPPADARDASEPIDLSGVEPRYWAETKRRVEILREWCVRQRHSPAELEAEAARFGVSPSRFEKLAKIWRDTGDAARVSGKWAAPRTGPNARMVDAATRRAIEGAIAKLGPEALFTDILEEATERAERAGAPVASSGTVHAALMRARAQQARDAAAGSEIEVRVARVACVMTVRIDDRVVERPDLILAVEAPGGRIVAHRLVLKDDQAAATLEVLYAVRGGDPEAGVILADSLKYALDGRQTGGGATPYIFVSDASELLSLLIGGHIGSIPIRHRRRSDTAPDCTAPVSAADAVAAVAREVARHNGMRASG